MVKEVTLSIPQSYGDISLKKWLEFQKELKNYEGDEAAMNALMLSYLCGLEPTYLKGIAIDDYAIIKSELESFLSNTDLPLQKIIRIGDIEYGFEPNLSQMTYGAYADITSFKELTIDDNWAKIMSILYRPIVHKKGEMYSIQSYKGEMDADKFLEVGMDIHFGALFFFVNLLMDLLNYTLNSTIAMADIPVKLKPILARSGKVMQQLLNSRMEILKK